MTARDESRSAPKSREVEASYRRGAIRRWWTLSGLSGAASAGRKALEDTNRNVLIFDSPSTETTVVIAGNDESRAALRAWFDARPVDGSQP